MHFKKIVWYFILNFKVIRVTVYGLMINLIYNNSLPLEFSDAVSNNLYQYGLLF